MEQTGDKVRWAPNHIAHCTIWAHAQGSQAAQQGLKSERRSSQMRRCTLQVGPQIPHELKLVYKAGNLAPAWTCSLCGRYATTQMGKQKLEQTECQKSVVNRFPASASASLMHGHKIKRTGSMVWCNTCGRHAVVRLRGLKQQCPGAPAKPSTTLSRLRSGLHPTTKEVLGCTRGVTLAEWQSLLEGG